MESGHVRRPQAARSTGRPQYHGGRRGMRDEENEEDKRRRRGFEQYERRKKRKDEMEGQMMAKSGDQKGANVVFVVFSN